MATVDITPELPKSDTPRVRRLNRLPVIFAITLAVVVVMVVVYGLSTRGYYGPEERGPDRSTGAPARSFGDRLKDGVPDGIIEPPIVPAVIQPQPLPPSPAANPFQPAPTTPPSETPIASASEDWRARLQREQEEQYLRELHRQRMLSLQADQAALDSPIAVEVHRLSLQQAVQGPAQASAGSMRPDLSNLYATLGAGQITEPNNQGAKENFFNQSLQDLGYLANGVVPAMSPYELKRGSVIPATLITGINSDLPGRIIAQVSQNVFDSVSGHHLLIPQGSRLLGRYDSKVTFGQRRALVIWTDIVFPNGATLQIAGMAGTDAQGYGGFADQIDNHYFEVFGSAILIAAIGAGIDMALPQDRNSSNNDGTDAARRSFAETFGRVADRTIDKNMDVQPTVEIRPGYIFNILVDQDMVFPNSF
ncbi:IncP-type conjugal transfer protein TrbI (plasmid) [Devosia neptuniae]|uniref:IncP-type conjugal transfer protein TrbI n=1 Tax=Devosia neptuniae TaxID=191302 RepID=A0ABY6CA99_9HYPH|nr:IncP-type conjugal transfer protein TrbI [Devosia neptuniae]UXN67916.1 IncP-type conjugal transfer protein TrbI [Devosia neptuniae]